MTCLQELTKHMNNERDHISLILQMVKYVSNFFFPLPTLTSLFVISRDIGSVRLHAEVKIYECLYKVVCYEIEKQIIYEQKLTKFQRLKQKVSYAICYTNTDS